MSAFNGDPRLKAELLERLDETSASDGDFALVDVSAGPDARATLAETFGLHRGLVDMIAQSHPTRPTPEDWALTRRIVAAISPGADLGAVMHDWTLWAWNGADPALRGGAEDDSARNYGDAVADLHRRALSNTPPSSREWRAQRNATVPEAKTAGDYFAIEAMTAGCWDLRAMEGAATDVADTAMKAWFYVAELNSGWAQQDREAFQDALNRAAGLLLDQPRASTQFGRNRELWRAFDTLMDRHEEYRDAGTRGIAHQEMLIDTVFGMVRCGLLEKLGARSGALSRA